MIISSRITVARSISSACLLTWSVSLLATKVIADDQDPAAAAATEKFNTIADQEARRFHVSFADDAGASFELAPKPLLVWTNPVSGSIRGRVYLWMQQGIPTLVASVYKYDEQPHVSSEFHALARRPITGKSGSGEPWNVRTPSVEFTSVPKAPQPGASRSSRLSQMRELARRFTASRTDPDKNVWELRLLSQPLYRYPEAAGRPDGALFVFVQGTNPDVILLVESGGTSDKPEWTFALARMHRYELNVQLDGAPLHQFKALTSQETVDKLQPYTVFRTQLQ